MSRHLLAGVVLVFLTGTSMANPPPSTGDTPLPGNASEETAKPSVAATENTPGNKENPLVQARKPDDKKLNKLKVYPCF